MFKNKFTFLTFLFLCFFAYQNISAQLSKKHFLPPITSGDQIENQYIYISTPKNKSIAFTIKPIGKPSSEIITGQVSNSVSFSTSSTDIGDQLFKDPDQTATIMADKGYIIEAEDVIYVSVRMRSANGFQAGAIVSKGSSALGTEFRMGGFINTNPVGGYLNFASIMATENNTNITFEDMPAGININNYSGTLPININLNEGETYIVSVSVDNGGNPNDLIGTFIKSNKPIVVNSGSATGSFHEGSGRDYGVDQIVDASKIGSKYILVRGDGNDEWENALIIAHEDNTEVKINRGNVISTLNKGDFFIAEGSNYNANGNMYIQTSKPSFVYQGIGGINENNNPSQANQGMFFVPPLSCENRGDVNNIASISKIGDDIFEGGITIVTNKDAKVTINGSPIANFNTSGPFSVSGTDDYETYRVSGLNNNVAVTSTGELYCAYFNYNGFATSGSFYSGFPSAPEINFDTTVQTLGNCIPNITLQAANTDLFDSFKWEYYNETSLTWEERSSLPNYKPIESEPGKYRLIGTVNCTGATFESIEIPVSICPDDFDGDLIIDNVDVDIDNDGILNCEESLGNANLDLTDFSIPVVIFQDNSTNNSIASGAENQSGNLNGGNSFVGQNNGDFTTTVNTGNNSNINYEINFTQNVNIKFTEANVTTHTIENGESFVLKIGPNTKNLTLLDPDDLLLIDTNFDGEYETGVTNISASEIHFIFNPSPTGTTPFQFVANHVKKLVFEHKTNNTTATSTFNGNISLTCFSLDSDGDGIENMFDLDSDNDGIPDISEAFSQPISISNSDIDLDGLDDVFNNASINLDIDSDGVLNYIDLDSDNDGIFDSTEAGHNLDIDFDGVVDNANAIVGINGLVNSLEIVADSKILALNYTIANTDGDIEFDFVELDADNDDCYDVIEAGFTDINNNGKLGNNPIQVDAKGKVINTTDGYTTPNANYITSAPIILNTPFLDVTFCEDSTDTITIDSNADSFQWEVSTDGTTWTTITDNRIYNGSTTTTLQIIDVPISYNNYQYKVILNKSGNSCGITSNEISLKINPLPTVTNPAELQQCDTDPDKQTTFNLTEAEINISNNPKDSFEYFSTEANAIAGTPQIADKTSYFVDTTGEAWVRTISEFGCYIISKINLNVSYTPNEPYENEFISCDDFLDEDGNNTISNSDTDGITFFDFSIAPSLITSDPDVKVEFYESEDERTKSINEIQENQDISQYRNKNIPNTTGNRFPIYYKLISKSNHNCSGLGQIYLQVDSVPTANPVADLELCDDVNDGDGINGIVQSFDLESQNAAILGTQNPANFTVTYHLSALDANTGNSPQSSPFANTTRDTQKIFVRVSNNTTNCFTDHTSFNVIVNPLPIANFVQDLEICDDNSDGSARNGFSQSIDLESQNAEVLGTQDPTINMVTYHRSLAEAQNGTNPLISPYSNATPNRETIFVRVYNSSTMCANGISNFDVIINPEPNFVPVSNLSYCDDMLDGDDTNGSIQNIDLESQISNLLGALQDPDDFIVTFHNSQIDATSGNSPIASPYTNTNSTETIYVRILNKATSCINDDATFDVIINFLPDFTVTTPQILCLNDLPLNIAVENPRDVYTYVWTDVNGTVLNTTSTDNINITTGGTYTVTATTTNGTMCSRVENIVIEESNPATLEESFITIIDESNNIGSEDNISIYINKIDNDLGPGDYQFAILNTDDNTRTPTIGFQDESIFENLEGGIYKIIVNDKNGCSPDAELLISVIQFPKFFTPNGDGKNDTWVIKGANKTFYPNSSINIFNRFGKLVAQIPIDGQGWDGTYNGKTLASDDYWFNIQLIPANTSKQPINKKGHFSLLRR